MSSLPILQIVLQKVVGPSVTRIQALLRDQQKRAGNSETSQGTPDIERFRPMPGMKSDAST